MSTTSRTDVVVFAPLGVPSPADGFRGLSSIPGNRSVSRGSARWRAAAFDTSPAHFPLNLTRSFINFVLLARGVWGEGGLAAQFHSRYPILRAGFFRTEIGGAGRWQLTFGAEASRLRVQRSLCRGKLGKRRRGKRDLGQWRQSLVDESLEPPQRRSLVARRVGSRQQFAQHESVRE